MWSSLPGGGERGLPGTEKRARDLVVETIIGIFLSLYYTYKYSARRFIHVILFEPRNVSMRCSPFYRLRNGRLGEGKSRSHGHSARDLNLAG